MSCNRILEVYFSPGGTTRRITERIAGGFSGERMTWDVLEEPDKTFDDFCEGDVLVVGMPVFAGRIPSVCAEGLKKLRGNGAKAIAVVAYGNRAYEDALLELKDTLEGQGLRVFAAGAVVAQHSIFPEIAAGRPDQEDMNKLDEFAGACAKGLLEPEDGRRLSVPGNVPYRELTMLPYNPSADETCDGCGKCVGICPVGAINRETPGKTNGKLCINCTACIYICPRHARGFRDPAYETMKHFFAQKCAEAKEAEFFI